MPLKKTATLSAISVMAAVAALLAWLAVLPANTIPSDIPAPCQAAVAQLYDSMRDKTAREDCDIRRWYTLQIALIAPLEDTWQHAGVSLPEQSRCAFALRHHARLVARTAMPHRVEVIALRLRDLLKYGNPDGPDFETLFEKQHHKTQGNIDDNTAYQNIINSAQITDEAVNKTCE